MPAVVVTGVGLISAAGSTAQQCWDTLLSGATGIVPNTVFPTDDLQAAIAGVAPLPEGEEQELDRCYRLARRACAEALAHAGLGRADAARAGLVLGSSLGAMPSLEDFHRDVLAAGAVRDRAAARAGIDTQLHCAADYVAGEFGLGGPRVVTSNACAAGAVALGYAAELLWRGDADVVICGGVDPLTTLSAHGFSSLGALAESPCSPFAASDGLSLGEGAGFLVLESEEHARARGAAPLARLAGYDLSSDGFHQTAPDPGGDGARRAMEGALAAAALGPGTVDYVNLHGTGTPTNDAVEPKAIRSVFDAPPPVSSTKSVVGHTLGAAGAVEAVVGVLALTDGVLPPTVGTRGDAERTGLDIVPDRAREAPVRTVLSNSFAFGGNNAAVVLRHAAEPAGAADAAAQEAPVITGIAALAGSAQSTAEVLAALRTGEPVHEQLGPLRFARLDQAAVARRINPAKVRKMDPMSVFAAGAVADLHAAFGKPDRAGLARAGIVLGTGYGPLSAVAEFHRGVVEHGSAGANPTVFANTVQNAAAGHLSVLHRYRGFTATLTCGGTSTVSALYLARAALARGQADRIVVVVVDEFPELAAQVYGATGNARHGALGEAAVALTVERADTARARGAAPLASLAGIGMAGEPAGIGRVGGDPAAWAHALTRSLKDAGPGEPDLVGAAATGHRTIDGAEAAALDAAGLAAVARSTPKAVLGETVGSAGALALLDGIDRLRDGGRLVVSSYALGGSYQAAVFDVPAGRPDPEGAR
ncbi:hypothetical protein AXK56_07340 [Tsukamurella pulmonis]|uniref:3-oxoacyl-[acyl-carrier-protein] synthase II n=2 Tax=Tsukamurella pulmonis TaxID=47312 RepID=A0A1H1CD35_9ACTN|nr:beta-ketoacyl-[acyl-carrier-protein] synthase family protein [Tsukamurella pulmonis]KXO89954.1 hypothetical protein AXK56_07340 [Tsukamurella pulmonis]SDQ62094.1 3-oxoacyl-[acyl-carrier-protein] synthase II [Tsukamurella pulmonis]SUP23858.1 3-oxoacyl-[acyl-carrier-protein] synthase 2 [Tsukamurella pulmonis]